MEILECDDAYFSQRDVLECGQIFRYEKLDQNSYGVFSRDKYARLVTTPQGVQVFTDDEGYFRNFLDLSGNYAARVKRISAISPTLSAAMTARPSGKDGRITCPAITARCPSYGRMCWKGRMCFTAPSPPWTGWSRPGPGSTRRTSTIPRMWMCP